MAPKLAIAPRPKPLAPLSAAPGQAPPASSRTEARPTLTTSKEWVVPPRPKPGRKPAQVEPDSSRKALNRASQRAFRERRQEYVGELEEKVRQLESGEGEKSVFFQQQAQKAKEESVALRAENDNLRRIIDSLRAELADQGVYGDDKVDLRRDFPLDFEDAGPAKRPRRGSTRSGIVVVDANKQYSDYLSSPPSPQTSSAAISPPQGLGGCGFCSSEGDCFCADVGYHLEHHHHDSAPVTTAAALALTSPRIKIEEDIDYVTSSYQPAVPLRFRKTTTAKVSSVWKIEPTPVVSASTSTASTDKPALCNGDPSNCPACSDDPFGKAFCESLSQSVCSNQPCTGCPSHTTKKIPTPPPDIDAETEASLFESLTDLPCCGDPEMCGSLTCGPKKDGDAVESLPRSVPSGVRTAETVPCNEAWTVLKSHPNIAFADLQMLAEVVAKRTHCDGPVPSPPSALAPTRLGTPPLTLPKLEFADSSSTGMLTELVPHSTLLCAADAGPRKRLTVERGAVNDALAILDRAVGRGGPLRR